MRKSFFTALTYPVVLVLIIGLAYFCGKKDWLHLGGKFFSSMAQIEVSAPISANRALPHQKVMTLEDVKAKFADLLTGNWPALLKTNTDKQNFIRGFLRSDQFDPKNVQDIIAMLHDAPDSNDKQIMIYELLGRISGSTNLGGANPALTLQLLDNLSDPAERQQILGSALIRIATDDPREAWNELNKFSQGSAPPGVYAAIFSSFAKQNPKNAAADAASLPTGRERGDALQGVAKGWLAVDPQAAINWASGLPPGNSGLLNGMIQSLASTNPTLASSYLNKITDPTTRNDTITAISRKLATGPDANPAAALTWLNQVATGSTYQTAVANLFSSVVATSGQYTQNVLLVGSLLANVTDPSARQAAITSVASGWSQSDPQAALAWVQTLPNSDATARAAALNTIVTTWSNINPAAAIAFVQKSSDPSAYLPIAPALAQTMAATSPQEALSFAQSLPAGTAQTQALSNALVGVAGSNFTAAWTDATNLPQGDSQNTIMTNLVGMEANKDPAQAAALLGQISDPAAQLAAANNVSITWVKQDPQAFSTWLDTLPTGDMRDTAIVQLVSSSQTTKNPAGVLQWVNTVSNPKIKRTLLLKLMQNQNPEDN